MALDTALASASAALQKEVADANKFDMLFKEWDKEVSEILQDPEMLKDVLRDKGKIDAHMKVLNGCMPQVKKMMQVLGEAESLVSAHTSYFHARLLKMGVLMMEVKKMQTGTAANIKAANDLHQASVSLGIAINMGLALNELEEAEKAAKNPAVTQAMDQLYPSWEQLTKEVTAFRDEATGFVRLLNSLMPK
jgi:hypothetical protein